ncbi:MAG: AbrB/MazE/SpoVT family DNA-binding domain-containing protein [Clostridia bacterium]|nr:AbrB/MazE/SpoVT family DNA-binding domain-containing protein [Clostridia bacterium]
MKETGVSRPLDPLGRVVIPIEIRRNLNINQGDLLEFFVEDSSLILKKYQAACVLCGSQENLQEIKGKNICKACKDELNNK